MEIRWWTLVDGRYRDGIYVSCPWSAVRHILWSTFLTSPISSSLTSCSLTDIPSSAVLTSLISCVLYSGWRQLQTPTSQNQLFQRLPLRKFPGRRPFSPTGQGTTCRVLFINYTAKASNLASNHVVLSNLEIYFASAPVKSCNVVHRKYAVQWVKVAEFVVCFNLC